MASPAAGRRAPALCLCGGPALACPVPLRWAVAWPRAPFAGSASPGRPPSDKDAAPVSDNLEKIEFQVFRLRHAPENSHRRYALRQGTLEVGYDVDKAVENMVG